MKHLRTAALALGAVLLAGYLAFSLMLVFHEDSGAGSGRRAGTARADSLETLLSRFLDQIRAGELDAVIAATTDAFDDHPNVPHLHYLRGFAYLQQGRLDQAIRDFTTALDIQPTYAPAYNYRARAYLDQGDLDGAIADATTLADLEPDNAQGYVVRAMAYLRQQDVERARPDVTRALELDPTNAAADALRRQIGRLEPAAAGAAAPGR